MKNDLFSNIGQQYENINFKAQWERLLCDQYFSSVRICEKLPEANDPVAYQSPRFPYFYCLNGIEG